MKNFAATRCLLAGILLFFGVGLAHAQATRTWVSGVGDDANPCSRTAPCKTFAGAISKTAPAGIIDVLDPGGFGALTVTKAITIEAVGTVAGVLVSGTNGFVIAAGANDVVTLRGLSIEGVNAGLNGVRFTSGAKLVIENSTIKGFTQNGIDFEPTGVSQLVVNNTTVSDSGNAAVFVQAGASGSASASLKDVRLAQSKYGLVNQKGTVSITKSVVSGHTLTGIGAMGSSAQARVNVDDSVISDCGGTGVTSFGSQAAVYLSRSSVTNNGTGLQPSLGGQLVSYGNNRIALNTANGSPSSTIAEQ